MNTNTEEGDLGLLQCVTPFLTTYKNRRRYDVSQYVKIFSVFLMYVNQPLRAEKT